VIAALVVLSVLVIVAVSVALFALAIAIQAARAAAMSRRPTPTPTETVKPADNIKGMPSFWSSQEALFRSFDELLRPAVTCSVCGQRNRLSLSRGGARCGRCKQMLMH
jgi:hypothetical protein